MQAAESANDSAEVWLLGLIFVLLGLRTRLEVMGNLMRVLLALYRVQSFLTYLLFGLVGFGGSLAGRVV